MSESTGKKPASSTEDLFNVKINDETQRKLEKITDAIRRIDLVNERESMKRLVPVYAERREALKSVPKFWAVALMNNPTFTLHVPHQDDQRAISHLVDVWVERDQAESRVFTIEFHFDENPYFSDRVLKKEYKYIAPESAKEDQPDEHGITLSMIEFDWGRDVVPQASPISWKSNAVNLTKLYPRTEEDGDVCDPGSFFNFFEKEGDPFDLGLLIANDVFTEAVDWFTGKARDMLEDDESEEDEEEDEEDDEEEEEIDLEKPKPKKQKRH